MGQRKRKQKQKQKKLLAPKPPADPSAIDTDAKPGPALSASLSPSLGATPAKAVPPPEAPTSSNRAAADTVARRRYRAAPRGADPAIDLTSMPTTLRNGYTRLMEIAFSGEASKEEDVKDFFLRWKEAAVGLLGTATTKGDWKIKCASGAGVQGSVYPSEAWSILTYGLKFERAAPGTASHDAKDPTRVPMTPLMIAAEMGSLPTVVAMLSARADAWQCLLGSGVTAVTYAAAAKRWSVVEHLCELAGGAPAACVPTWMEMVGAPPSSEWLRAETPARTPRGESALDWCEFGVVEPAIISATRANNLPATKALVAAGAVIRALPYGDTLVAVEGGALNVALLSHSLDVAEHLIACGVDPSDRPAGADRSTFDVAANMRTLVPLSSTFATKTSADATSCYCTRACNKPHTQYRLLPCQHEENRLWSIEVREESCSGKALALLAVEGGLMRRVGRGVPSPKDIHKALLWAIARGSTVAVVTLAKHYGAYIFRGREREGSNRGTLVHAACCAGDQRMVDAVLQIPGVDVNERDEHGLTPLMQCLNGSRPHYQSAVTLIGDRRTNLGLSAATVGAGSPRGPTAMHYAAAYGASGVVAHLLANDRMVGAFAPLVGSCKHPLDARTNQPNDPGSPQWPQRDGDLRPITALGLAVLGGDKTTVGVLVRAQRGRPLPRGAAHPLNILVDAGGRKQSIVAEIVAELVAGGAEDLVADETFCARTVFMQMYTYKFAKGRELLLGAHWENPIEAPLAALDAMLGVGVNCLDLQLNQGADPDAVLRNALHVNATTNTKERGKLRAAGIPAMAGVPGTFDGPAQSSAYWQSTRRLEAAVGRAGACIWAETHASLHVASNAKARPHLGGGLRVARSLRRAARGNPPCRLRRRRAGAHARARRRRAARRRRRLAGGRRLARGQRRRDCRDWCRGHQSRRAPPRRPRLQWLVVRGGAGARGSAPREGVH